MTLSLTRRGTVAVGVNGGTLFAVRANQFLPSTPADPLLSYSERSMLFDYVCTVNTDKTTYL